MCSDWDVLTTIHYNEYDPISQVKGKFDSQWDQHSTPLPVGQYQIIFEYTMGMAYFSDMGLDHVALEPCKEQTPEIHGK